MVGWQRHVQSLIRHVGKRVENHGCTSAANFSSSSHFLKIQTPSYQTISRPLHQYFQHLGISSSRNLLADSSDGAPHQSSVTPLSASSGEKIEEQNQKSSSRPSQVQFVLKGMNQVEVLYLGKDCIAKRKSADILYVKGRNSFVSKFSPNKVNLVAKLVRGMRVEDALLQLQVTDKQAAKTMYQALHSARADATYNHGLDPDRLLVAGAFVGKGFLGFRKNRLYYHGKSNDGTKVRPNYQLTVTLREIYPEEEEEIAKQRADNFLYIKKRLRLTKQENKFVSHHLIGNHKGKGSTSQRSGMAS